MQAFFLFSSKSLCFSFNNPAFFRRSVALGGIKWQ